jgi:hypothetical protein
MSELEVLENIATTAIHRLREETLTAGQPFMININGLPKDQCYLEYPDRSIKLVTFVKGNHDFLTIKKLSLRDGLRLRKRLGLI